MGYVSEHNKQAYSDDQVTYVQPLQNVSSRSLLKEYDLRGRNDVAHLFNVLRR